MSKREKDIRKYFEDLTKKTIEYSGKINMSAHINELIKYKKEVFEKDIPAINEKISELRVNIEKETKNINKKTLETTKKMEFNNKKENETLKMKKKMENIENTISKKKNLIYVLFGVNIILALFICLGIYLRINKTILKSIF